MSTSTKNINVSKDEYALFGKALPYVAMLIGAALLFFVGFFTRVGIWAQAKLGDTSSIDSTKVVTWCVLLSTILLCAVAWKLFSQRKGLFIQHHATATVLLGHVWLLVSLWEDQGDWMFGIPTLFLYFFGAGVIGLSWSIRRWAFRAHEQDENSNGFNPFEEMGLGSSYIDQRNSHAVTGGGRYRLKLALGKTVENAKAARVAIAQLAGKPRRLVHISETDSGIEGQVDVFIQDEDPFGHKIVWAGPDRVGASIAEPVSFGTYDNGTRPEIYITGKDGGSSQHFLTMGVSGSGKSKAWQVLYGSILNRSGVSVIFGDPAKGIQTGGPIAAGLEWFATTQRECEEQITAIMRAIPARTDYLTSRGLSQWEENCGLNFLIFHLEEAARFSDTEMLIQAVEAARSAGIMIVLSLQRATADRMNTSTRYNLGGSMCFGVRNKRDASLALSEYTIQSGAEPHVFQDREPGRMYLEAAGLDSRMFAHQIQTDWINTRVLERVVDEGAEYRTALDNVTSQALGTYYFGYRELVDSGRAQWQELRINRYSPGEEQPTVENPVVGEVIDSGTPKSDNFKTDPEEKRQAELAVWSIILNFAENGKMTFSSKDLQSYYRGPTRGAAWFSKTLGKWAQQNRVRKMAGTNGMYEIIRTDFQ